MKLLFAWWRHKIETFSALLAICAGNSPVPGEFPHKGQVLQSIKLNARCVANPKSIAHESH